VAYPTVSRKGLSHAEVRIFIFNTSHALIFTGIAMHGKKCFHALMIGPDVEVMEPPLNKPVIKLTV
jgi:hypothetical protein